MVGRHSLARRRRVALALTLGLAGAAMVTAAPRTAAAVATYANPVSRDFADTFADPSVIRAKDGAWYAYATSDPLREGETDRHLIPMARSSDLVNWTYVGDVFGPGNRPVWAAPDASFWAPDIRYLDGSYYLYYVVTQTTVTPEPNDSAIGVATAPTPTGPWTDAGAPVVGPRHGPGGAGDFKWTFDPAEFTDRDGSRYLYYGSYYGGVFATRLSPDGKRAVGTPVMVAIDNRYEGAYVIRRGGWYYLFGSSADCCAGPTTGYSVFVGRSTSPLGPFVDRQGVPLLASRTGGTIVVSPNGNRWVGTGHNAVATDLSGQSWLVYHAIDRNDPYLNEPFGINQRPMLLDRLDWVGGWPTVRAGSWASDDPQPTPVTTWAVGDDFNGGGQLGAGWRQVGPDGWVLAGGQGEGYASVAARGSAPTYLVSTAEAPTDARVEADLRLTPTSGGESAVGLVTAYHDAGNRVVSWLDALQHALVTEVVANGRDAGRVRTPLPPGFHFGTWHNLAVEVRGTSMSVAVTEARLGDPVAVQQVSLPASLPGPGAVGAAGRGGTADADNLGAAPLFQQVANAAPPPTVGALDPAFSDEFDGSALDPAWSWMRAAAGQETGGVYRWPTQDGDLFKDTNSASVLLRDAPAGDYTVETKLTIDLGTDTVRNFQQAGLVAYVNDDLYIRFDHTAIWNTRWTEFGKEMPFAGGIAYGAMAVAPPADTTWLRLSHRVDPATGEHDFRASVSRDGRSWVWGGTWTLPAGTSPRIGLLSMGGVGAIAQFDYVRVYRP
jgi:arabinan endo-1,5-alpha-L-arabinosidase